MQRMVRSLGDGMDIEMGVGERGVFEEEAQVLIASKSKCKLHEQMINDARLTPENS
jgi:hypothetical protein